MVEIAVIRNDLAIFEGQDRAPGEPEIRSSIVHDQCLEYYDISCGNVSQNLNFSPGAERFDALFGSDEDFSVSKVDAAAIEIGAVENRAVHVWTVRLSHERFHIRAIIEILPEFDMLNISLLL